MAFRKRNAPVAISKGSTDTKKNGEGTLSSSKPQQNGPSALPGVRSSPADGRATTSTGTPSLDSLLAGHAGLPLGHSLLVEETGTTDYAGVLLRCYAAEGIVQGHHVHVVGAGPSWVKDLPGVVEGRRERHAKDSEKAEADAEKMKIAWRYERLGAVGEREARPSSSQNPSTSTAAEDQPFCHTFDLTKRLTLPPNAKVTQHAIDNTSPSSSPFTKTIQSLASHLTSPLPNSVHRIVIPSLLSPLTYPPHASQPHHVLQFLHALRALLWRHATRTTALISLPLTLHSRTTALTRWSEHLLDGTIELAPFPFRADDYAQNKPGTSGAATANEERPQGMVKVHKLPVFHERGGGGGVKGLGDDMAFTVSRRRFWIGAFSLPPEEGDTEAQRGVEGGGGGMPAKGEMEF